MTSRAARAERHADADLPRPLGDRQQHHVHDADAADEQRHARDAGEQRRHRPARAFHRARQLLERDRLETGHVAGDRARHLRVDALCRARRLACVRTTKSSGAASAIPWRARSSAVDVLRHPGRSAADLRVTVIVFSFDRFSRRCTAPSGTYTASNSSSPTAPEEVHVVLASTPTTVNGWFQMRHRRSGRDRSCRQETACRRRRCRAP